MGVPMCTPMPTLTWAFANCTAPVSKSAIIEIFISFITVDLITIYCSYGYMTMQTDEGLKINFTFWLIMPRKYAGGFLSSSFPAAYFLSFAVNY